MKTDLFDFDLPEELIAARPLAARAQARMLEVRDGALTDRTVGDLPELLVPGDVVVVNDTKVIPARLTGRRGAARIECTLHKEVKTGDGGAVWAAFARPARRLSAGDRIEFSPDLAAEVMEKRDRGEVVLRFDRVGAALMAALEREGAMPLPPYIKREAGADAHDQADYQTMFASRPGAVAAPTAGLHFTPDLAAALTTRGVAIVRLTLHVGAGTFLPVTVEEAEQHKMHAEWGEISEEAARTINDARGAGGRVLAVGSTPLRLLESAADANGVLHPFAGETDIFILPGYRFRAVDLMLTNFHLPRSTLFMLVSAFSGRATMRRAYAHAIAARYRFYSYGDCCLLHPAGTGV